MEIINCLFLFNSAKEIGGAILLTKYIPTNFDTNNFFHNKAILYGDNYGTDPYKFLYDFSNGFN